ncbi:GYD domain-containing protein [Natrinema halophilum]|uniref:GYD domain-containing protein n=1 Tax=Natrinema halophilum TaxID=1699371 RepID=A0A7D5H4U0_9EURY|nr:GYD domain-containing protein [Natrinema halophilum]QLG50871.1 GYD domain-containing protein [Natrinema halophilum]
MPTYATLVDIDDRDVQNAQELASIWGEIKTEFEEHDSQLRHSYAVLGEYDFLIIFDAADREAAFKSALTLHRHGLEGKTMAIVDTDSFANLVDEI